MTENLASGDCFPAAWYLANELVDHPDVGPDVEIRIAHGWVLGQGPIDGVRHWHAWVELSGSYPLPGPDGKPSGQAWRLVTCHDRSNGKDLALPGQLYYKIGAIETVHRYSIEEAAAQMLASGHFGPWEPQPETQEVS